MVAKNGFFNFLKGKSKSSAISEEEELQRSYAMEKERSDRDHWEEEQEESIVTDEIISFCQDRLDEILALTDFHGETKLQSKSKNKLYLDIVNSSDVGRLIGKDGAMLEALQTLLKGFVYKKYACSIQVVIDIENYRKRRKESLKAMALKAAKVVLEKNKSVELKPMNGAERRIIHMLFKHHQQVQSYSKGEGFQRHIVLARRNTD